MLLQNLAESSLEIYHIATMQMLAHRQDESIYSQLCELPFQILAILILLT